METVSILIVNYNTADFVALALFALKKLTRHPYKVFIVDNQSAWPDYQKLKRAVGEYPNVMLERNETPLRGSEAHGFGLNLLMPRVDTPYFAILDADATWLRKDWDDVLIRQINDRVKVVGTEAAGGKHPWFPETYCIFFETQAFRDLGVDFMPRNLDAGEDTAWKLRFKYREHGYVAKLIEFKNTRTYKAGPFRDLITAEFYLDGDYQNIFASHFSRGSTLGADKYQCSWWGGKLARVPGLGPAWLRWRGEREKMQWLNICREIVERQA